MLRHSKIASPDDRRDLGYRDHARLSSSVPARRVASRFMNQSCSNFIRRSTLLAAVASASSSAVSSSLPSRLKVAAVSAASALRQRFEQRRCAAAPSRPREPIAADGLRRHRAGHRDALAARPAGLRGSDGPAPAVSLPSGEQPARRHLADAAGRWRRCAATRSAPSARPASSGVQPPPSRSRCTARQLAADAAQDRAVARSAARSPTAGLR